MTLLPKGRGHGASRDCVAGTPEDDFLMRPLRRIALLPKGRAFVRVAQQSKHRDPGVRIADQMPAGKPQIRDLESQGRGPT
jgi:hypothetical protein